jgi:hypothetical protein
MTESSAPAEKKKLLENPLVGSLVVPIAIVLIGALIIFGVTRMLSSERSHKDLVREMQSKTFGNRWIAAFELSKLIASKSIPQEDIPWLVENLAAQFKSAKDPRTKEFIIVALGAIGRPTILPTLRLGLNDPNKKIVFQSIVALGKVQRPFEFDWSHLLKYTKNEDLGLRSVAALTLATFKIPEGEAVLVSMLSSSDRGVRYSAATALINYKNEKGLPVLEEILSLEVKDSVKENQLNTVQVEALKISLLSALMKNKWNVLLKNISVVADSDKSLKVATKAREALKLLKN